MSDVVATSLHNARRAHIRFVVLVGEWAAVDWLQPIATKAAPTKAAEGGGNKKKGKKKG